MQKTQKRVKVIINVEAEEEEGCEAETKCERVEGKRLRLNFKYALLPWEVAITTTHLKMYFFFVLEERVSR